MSIVKWFLNRKNLEFPKPLTQAEMDEWKKSVNEKLDLLIQHDKEVIEAKKKLLC